jgi:hypothetical protein
MHAEVLLREPSGEEFRNYRMGVLVGDDENRPFVFTGPELGAAIGL